MNDDLRTPRREPDHSGLSQSVEIDLPKEESLPGKVGCNIHPWMGAWVVVLNDPYAAVSNKDGVLRLARSASRQRPGISALAGYGWATLKDVEVQGVKVDSKGRFKLKLTPGEDRKLEFKVTIHSK